MSLTPPAPERAVDPTPAAAGPAGTTGAAPGGAAPRLGRILVPALVALDVLLVLGLWGLGRRPLWVDEAISLGATRELAATWRGTGGTMALYYLMLTPWSWVSHDPMWLRLLSVLLAAVGVVLAWAALRRALDPATAAVAAVATAGSWLVVRYAQEARSYALVLALTSLGWFALVRALRADDEQQRRRWWRWYVAAAVLAPLAHGLAVLQLVAQVAVLALGADRQEWFQRLKGAAVLVVAVVGVLFVAGASDVASWIPPLSRDQAGTYLEALTAPGPLPSLVLLIALGLGVHVAVERWRTAGTDRDRQLALLPVAWGLIPPVLLLALSVLRPYLLARYVVASAPGLAALLAMAILGSHPGRRRPIGQAAIAVPVAVALLWGQLQLHRDAGDDWRGATAVVLADVEPGDALVLPNPSVRSAFDAAWAARDVELDGTRGAGLVAFSPVEPVGQVRRFYRVRDPRRLPSDMAESSVDRFWVVDQDGAGFDDTLTPFLADPDVRDHFEAVGRHELDGGVQVVLLTRRGAR